MRFIDIDDEVLRSVQASYGLRTKREAVDFALRRLLIEPFTRSQALAAEGSGRDGDRGELRGDGPAAVIVVDTSGGSNTCARRVRPPTRRSSAR